MFFFILNSILKRRLFTISVMRNIIIFLYKIFLVYHPNIFEKHVDKLELKNTYLLTQIYWGYTVLKEL
jgi:hypothetical protein